MNIDILKSKQFENACKTYLTMAFWCQSLTDEDDPLIETLDDLYGHEDVHESALDFIKGEVLAIYVKLSQMGFNDLRDDAIEAIMHGLGGSATGSGVNVNDNGPIFPLQEEDMRALDEWHRKQWGVRTLNMYPGDDGKVYVEGHERAVLCGYEVSCAESEGRNGILLQRNEELSCTWKSAAYHMLKFRAESGQTKYPWIKLIREVK